MFKGPAREYPAYARLITAAEVLFLEQGFRATGVNAILETAGVAKQTLYNHFSSKDELIAAVLRLKSRKVIAWLSRAESVDDLFDLLAGWFGEEGFRGCLFARAALEFPDPSHPAHRAAAAHTRKVFQLLERLCEGGRALACPAEHVLLLMEGATAVAAKTGAGGAAAMRAKAAAKTLLGG